MTPRHAPQRPANAARQGRAADARALYLASTERMRVTSTGEALVIARDDGAVQRIPVARLLRIVCNTRAEWSGAALALCLERGVPVSWLGHADQPLGHLWPCRPHASPLGEVLEALACDHLGWAEAYDHWLRRRRMHVLRTWASARLADGHAVPPEEWHRAKQAWVYRGEPCEVLPPVLQGMAAAFVAARLSAQGLQAHYWCAEGGHVTLADDLACLVWAQMNLTAGALAVAIEQPREAAAMFERWSGTCSGILHEHLSSLHAHGRREMAL